MTGVIQRVITVEVWGSKIDVKVTQKSKSVWIARGEYLGQSYETQDRTPTSAATAWARMVKYRTN